MIEHKATEIDGLHDAIRQQRSREARMARALQRILSAAEGDPRFEPMNWTDVAEVARRALETGHVPGGQAGA